MADLEKKLAATEAELARAIKRIEELEHKVEGYSSGAASLFAHLFHQIKLSIPQGMSRRPIDPSARLGLDLKLSKRVNAFVSAVRSRKGLKT